MDVRADRGVVPVARASRRLGHGSLLPRLRAEDSRAERAVSGSSRSPRNVPGRSRARLRAGRPAAVHRGILALRVPRRRVRAVSLWPVRADRLVPFSCKGRAVCPSCGGRGRNDVCPKCRRSDSITSTMREDVSLDYRAKRSRSLHTPHHGTDRFHSVAPDMAPSSIAALYPRRIIASPANADVRGRHDVWRLRQARVRHARTA